MNIEITKPEADAVATAINVALTEGLPGGVEQALKLLSVFSKMERAAQEELKQPQKE